MEVWKDIYGFEGYYQISNTGLVKSLQRTIFSKYRNRILREIIKVCPVNHRGYPRVQLTNASIKKIYSVHRLVAITFIPNPLNLPEVNHKNGIKSDNRLDNLEWCDKAFNERHASDNNLKLKGSKHKMAILDENQVFEIRKEIAAGVKQKLIALRFGVSVPTISSIKHKRNWSHI